MQVEGCRPSSIRPGGAIWNGSDNYRWTRLGAVNTALKSVPLSLHWSTLWNGFFHHRQRLTRITAAAHSNLLLPFNIQKLALRMSSY